MTSSVTHVAPAPSAEAEAHFSRRLSFETDCWDVHDALSNGATDFVVLDVRGRECLCSRPRPGRDLPAPRRDPRGTHAQMS